MSFYEDNVDDGSHCMSCCQPIGDSCGFPRACGECGGDHLPPRDKKLEKQLAMIRFEAWLGNTGVEHTKHNNGFHVVLKLPDGRMVDCWPSTRKWQLRGQKINRSGKALHDLVRQSLRPWS
jgi:hypothetical protein